MTRFWLFHFVTSHKESQRIICSKFPIYVLLTVISRFVYFQQTGIEETIRLLKMKQQQQVAQMSSSAAVPPAAPTLYSHGRHQQHVQPLGGADVSGLSAALRSISAARSAAATGFPHSKYVISFSRAASSDCKHSIQHL